MSYASTGLGQTSAVRVGAAARGDLVLANASLVASKILLGAAQKPAGIREVFIWNKLDAMRPGMAKEVAASRRRLVARGKARDQATFDAMRLAIANARMASGIEALRVTAAKEIGAEAFSGGLGQMSASDRTTACAVTGVTSTIGGAVSVIPVYGTIIGGLLSIGSSIASGAVDCTRDAREAAAVSAQAQVNLLAVQQAEAARIATAQSSQRMRLLLIGGGAIVVLGAGYFLLS